MKNPTPRRRGLALAAAGVMLASGGLAACGSSGSSSGKQTLTWYINPDVGNTDASKGGQASLALACSKASGGKYDIKVQLLPNSADDQRTQLLRRLISGDSSMDLMSMDPAYVTQFASAKLLAPVPADMVSNFEDDRVPSAIKGATFDGKLIAAPFWANTQLLWYRKSVAQAAGLDMSKPVTWAQIIAAAKKEKKEIGVQAKLYEGYSVWINALVAGGGGSIVKNPSATADDTKLGLNTPAGEDAATIISEIAKSGLGGPAMGSSDETAALNLFQSGAAAFLVNWPYTYAALTGNKSDIAATLYPRTVDGKVAAPPFGGIDLAVGKTSKHADLAYDAAACITDETNQASYMAKAGNPASRKAAFSDAAVKKAFPNGIAATILESLGTATPRPLSPYWADISTGLQQQFSPPSSVNSNTPKKAQTFISNVLKGKALL
ncbi:extracellular solute-binding protein [Allobranchiibius huperziae]|uniref:Multiple sugar transport system substrate-binding protein n=1 Tax=Allobranchiibius huperziae TaxID=1874116 RepID=A0A853DI01_9MICO|nr:extracellular solute-binding protein [Allobranchiibius huperziae]NYJ75653.1 multiple sugar transport system substrate-binding protein [Allobranchiibius huperziae]